MIFSAYIKDVNIVNIMYSLQILVHFYTEMDIILLTVLAESRPGKLSSWSFKLKGTCFS